MPQSCHELYLPAVVELGEELAVMFQCLKVTVEKHATLPTDVRK
jgi:hypothetical protein